MPYSNSFLILSFQLQISVEGLPQQVQAGKLFKTNYFEREASEIDAIIENEVKNQFSELYLDIWHCRFSEI